MDFVESLGTAVAIDLAVEHPPAALVLRSPFTSMAHLGQHHYPFLPVRLLLRDQSAAIDRIRQIRVPLLVSLVGTTGDAANGSTTGMERSDLNNASSAPQAAI